MRPRSGRAGVGEGGRGDGQGIRSDTRGKNAENEIVRESNSDGAVAGKRRQLF